MRAVSAAADCSARWAQRLHNRRWRYVRKYCAAVRCLGERANSLVKTTYKALRHYRGCTWRLGAIVAAALVLLHHEHDRTT